MLADFYNEPENQRMMANERAFSPADVSAFYRSLRGAGARLFILWRDAELLGDADLRGIDGAGVPRARAHGDDERERDGLAGARGGADFAILIGPRAAQGRGFGTAFATMVHAFAFGVLQLARVYASVLADNSGSRRLLEKLGHQADDSPRAKQCADDTTDITLSVGPREFTIAAAGGLRDLRMTRRMGAPSAK